MVTTVQIDWETKTGLNQLKIHSRKSYNDLILILIDLYFHEIASQELLIETLKYFGILN